MMSKILIYTISFYQRCISPLTWASCRYYPTCSEYSKIHLSKYGFFSSFIPILSRFLSCHPFSKRNPWDPVR
ncbi:MAG: membrane protein insertion efficiency factor YidD [Candidatus Marinimicrobia bacterium]|nr:membrane protein insertion efficiency factor YidD [Candidatus Neomarinimicrobiota bacterium]